jgi:hypothetical protein
MSSFLRWTAAFWIVVFTAAARGNDAPAEGLSTLPVRHATLLFQENFEDAGFTARGWYEMPTGAFPTVATEHAPGSRRSVELRFAPGQTNPTPRATGRHAFTPTETLYLEYWVKHGDTWVGSGKPYHPHEIHILTNADVAYVGPANTFLTVDIEHNYQAAGGVAVLGIQDSRNIDLTKINQDLSAVTEQRAVAGCNGSFDTIVSDCYPVGSAYLNGKGWKSTDIVFSNTPGPSYKGNWHRVEVYLQMNTIKNGKGQLDGVARTWVDGRLVIDRPAMMYRTAARSNLKFNQFLLAPYMGDGSPRAQTMWIDDIVVATARPAGR